jgi:hypothetical protein
MVAPSQASAHAPPETDPDNDETGEEKIAKKVPSNSTVAGGVMPAALAAFPLGGSFPPAAFPATAEQEKPAGTAAKPAAKLTVTEVAAKPADRRWDRGRPFVTFSA